MDAIRNDLPRDAYSLQKIVDEFANGRVSSEYGIHPSVSIYTLTHIGFNSRVLQTIRIDVSHIILPSRLAAGLI